MEDSLTCPVCTLYLRPGITLESHLKSHPKQKVIEALIKLTQVGPQNTEIVATASNECPPQPTSAITVFPPMNVNPNLNQVPTNHSFIYQQFMSSSGTQPILNVNPINQQFVAVPTVFNPQMPQMVCSPYIIQQQQQVQIMAAAAAGNIQPFIPRSSLDLFAPSNPAICAATEQELQDPLCSSATNSPCKSSVITVNSSSVSSVTDSSFRTQSVRETNCETLLTINNINDNSISIPQDIQDEDDSKDTSNISNIIIQGDDEVTSVHINIAPIDESKQEQEQDQDCEENKIEEDLDKACQTTQIVTEKDHNEILEPEDNVDRIVLIASEHEIYDETQTVQIIPNETVVLDIDGFILPNDLMPHEQSIISKVSEIECIRETNREDRPQVLMNIGEEIIRNSNMIMNPDENCILPDYGEDRFMEEKLDEECISRESLNIRADERMPPRGELSEQESNGASEIGWGSRIYQEGSSGMSTSYDLLARESWEASDYSDSELPPMPPLQSRIQPPMDYSHEDPDEPEENVENSSPTFNFICSTCGKTFRCPKERRVHQAQEHTSNTSNIKTVKKMTVRSNLEKNELPEVVKNEDVKNEAMKYELPEGDEEPIAQDLLVLSDKKEMLCNTCGELLPSMRAFHIHNKKIHNIRIPRQNLICKTCQEAFLTPEQFADHLKEHPLECKICGKHFYRIPNLKLHLKRHTGIRPHKCDICSKAFFAKQKLREHLNIHTGHAPIKCTMCSESFRRYSNLVQHRNHHHLNIRKKIKDFVCHCGEIYHSINKLNWHKETHEPKPKSCKYCHEKFIHRASLTRHIRRSHNQRYVPKDERDDENVECKICKGIYLKTSIEAHLFTHTGKKLHPCGICNREFSTKWNLKLHKWTHAAPTSKPYKCETCNSAFIRQSDYISHMNSHKSIRPYTCNYCGCKFIRKYNCVRHVREHEEGKSFNCGVCNKSFHRSYYLKEHMRVHTGVRPFSCHICGKTSTTKSNHNKHMKIHHAREPVMTEG